MTTAVPRPALPPTAPAPPGARAGRLAGTTLASLACHVALAGALLVPRRPAAAPDAATPPTALGGETFLLDAPGLAAPPGAVDPTTSATPERPPEDGPARAKPAPPAPSKKVDAPRHETAGAVGEGGDGLVYGAVGERGAAPLVRELLRAFPLASSADPAWVSAPLGSAGRAVVTITLDDAGHVTAADVAGTPSPALREGVRRTLALVRGRTFVARGAVTRLALEATLREVALGEATREGVRGGVYALGGPSEGREDSAFFTLAVGRRLDVRGRELSARP